MTERQDEDGRVAQGGRRGVSGKMAIQGRRISGPDNQGRAAEAAGKGGNIKSAGRWAGRQPI